MEKTRRTELAAIDNNGQEDPITAIPVGCSVAMCCAPRHPVGSSYLTDRYGRKRHGYALAWHVAGGNSGTLAVPLIAGPLLGLWGWRPVLYLAALPGIIIGIAILIIVDERDLLDRRVSDHHARLYHRRGWARIGQCHHICATIFTEHTAPQ